MLSALVFAVGCGGGDGGDGAGTPTRPDVPNASDPGAQITMNSGCLACHRLGSAGNADVGGDLTRIGGKLSAAQIEKSLVDPPDQMPSFESLDAADRDRIVAYLARLK